MPTVFMDVETLSLRDLKACGAYVYARDPSTDVHFVCYAIDDGAVQSWRSGDPVPTPFADPTRFTFVFDNWTFERAIIKHVLIPRYGFADIPTEQMDCAQRRALASAFPAELGLRCLALGLPYEKDKAAAAAMRRLARAGHKYKRAEDRERDLELLLQRCTLDVEMTRACYQHPRLRPLPPDERKVMLLDAHINDRGVCANVAFLEAAQALAVAEREDINAKLAALTNGEVTSVDQTPRIVRVVNAAGHSMTSINKRSVAAVLAREPDDFTREVLTLRRLGAFASPKKSKKLLGYADPVDHRIRGALRYHGAGTGRWTSVGAQLHNFTRNDADYPVTLVDAVLAGDRAELARYGNPIAIIGQLARASLCAAPGHELICADLAGIESRVTAWFAGETWKLDLFRRYDATRDKLLDPYRVLAHHILRGTVSIEAITAAQRQLGKYSELAFGFGGSKGAWRGIVGDDGRSDAEVMQIVYAWRSKHPATQAFWRRMMHAAVKAIRTGQAVEVNPPPLPRITAAFDGYALTLTLPSGRAINYPGARLVENDFDEFDVEYMDNARTAPKKKAAKEKGTSGWRPARAWFGTLVENVVQGTARDLLAAAIVRAEARGLSVVHHNHDEVVIETPAGSISAKDVLALLLEPPPWAVGLPLGGKVRNGPLFFEGPATAEPPSETSAHVEPAVELHDVNDFDNKDDATEDEPADDITLAVLDEMDATPRDPLPSEGAPSFPAEPVSTIIATAVEPARDGFDAFTTDIDGYTSGKINCPFHDDSTPSCQLYADGHYHCFGCNAHGWIDEDMGLDDAVARVTTTRNDTDTLARGLELWDEAKAITGTLAERYLAETRKLDLAALPTDVSGVLRFHPRCPFGNNGTRHPCLLALFRDVESDAPAGIHRIGLTPNAQKIKRLTLGRWPSPRAIKLWPLTHKLTIGEGIETVLGAIRCGAVTPPAWAMGPKTDIANFPVLPGVKAITVLVDRSDPAALDGAETCAARYVAAGIPARWLRTVRVKDFNDVVMS